VKPEGEKGKGSKQSGIYDNATFATEVSNEVKEANGNRL
jgi:hypothetical protein